MEMIEWWHILILVFVVIEFRHWAQKQPRLYIRTEEKLYLKEKVWWNYIREEMNFATTRNINEAISFFVWSPSAKIQLKKLRKFEDDWVIKRIALASSKK